MLIAASVLLALTFKPVLAETLTVAIEDKDWTPYYVWIDGDPTGLCTEIAAGAIRHMGAEVEFVPVPWVRVLLSVETQKVDAGLCGTKTDERAAFSYYPDEPLLSFDATLFVRADSQLQSSDVDELKGRTFGLIKGYNYGDLDQKLESQGMIRLEALNRESLLDMLVAGRIDTVLDSIMPTVSDAQKLGINDQIRPLLPSLTETPGYLFFSQRPGHDALAQRFSDALKAFKETEEYTAILQRYGF